MKRWRSYEWLGNITPLTLFAFMGGGGSMIFLLLWISISVLEKLSVVHLVKIFSAFEWSRVFIIWFMESLSHDIVQFTSHTQLLKGHFTTILASALRSSNVSLPLNPPTKIWLAFYIFSPHSVLLIFLDFYRNNINIFGTNYEASQYAFFSILM
jgi:hypothetical protein